MPDRRLSCLNITWPEAICGCCGELRPLVARLASTEGRRTLDPAICLYCHRDGHEKRGSFIPPAPIIRFLLDTWHAEADRIRGGADEILPWLLRPALERIQALHELLDVVLEGATWHDHYHGPGEVAGGLCRLVDPAKVRGVQLLTVEWAGRDGFDRAWRPADFGEIDLIA